jgi:pimeloyl-ACP methyl ester carboxylesterase
VLVGHSLGGLTARVFAHEYAAEVAGVVLLESMHPHQAKPSATAAPPRAAAPASELSIYTLPARIGLLRLLAGLLDLKDGLSPEVANAYVAFTVVPRYIQTYLDEAKGVPDSLAQADAVTSFGALPLLVLSGALNQDDGWQEMQTDLLHLSSNSQHMIADQSGHNIQSDQPEATVGAIVTMVEQIRQQQVVQ